MRHLCPDLFIRNHGTDNLRVLRRSDKRFAEMTHSLRRTLAENVTTERLRTQNLSCSGHLKSLFGSTVSLLLGHFDFLLAMLLRVLLLKRRQIHNHVPALDLRRSVNLTVLRAKLRKLLH